MLLSIITLIVYFAVWAAVHSVMASYAAKQWARRLFGPDDRWYRLCYNIIAVVTAGPLVMLILYLPDAALYVVPAPWRWLMWGIEGLALLAMAVALLQTGLRSFLGLARPNQTPGRLHVRGFYCWVRHPLYSLGMLVIWLWPMMTVNFLTTIICFSIYLYVGSLFEERRLVAEFGDAYRAYQSQVPRFLPRRGCRYKPSQS
jgi:protein-S-isoprenylcysteine O-methyltransferase Ste14